MPSFFAHSAVGATASYIFKKRLSATHTKKLLLLSVVAANLPDADILLHQSPLGVFEAFTHRSFLHSLLFAAVAAVSITFAFYNVASRPQKIALAIYFFIVTSSHNFLDALTKGFGVAFFHPFDTTQYNLPITPLHPAGWSIAEFNANSALGREFLFIGLPILIILVTVFVMRKYKS